MGHATWLLVLTSGCALFTPRDAPKDAATEAAVCSGPTAICYESTMGTNNKSITCSLEPVATCDQRLVRYCDCATTETTGGALLFPAEADGTQSDVIYVNSVQLGSVSMSIQDDAGGNLLCAGLGETCPIDQRTCSGTSTLYKWRSLPRGPGVYRVEIFRDDTGGGPCNIANKMVDILVAR
jgi:hypothetical protein